MKPSRKKSDIAMIKADAKMQKPFVSLCVPIKMHPFLFREKDFMEKQMNEAIDRQRVRQFLKP